MKILKQYPSNFRRSLAMHIYVLRSCETKKYMQSTYPIRFIEPKMTRVPDSVSANYIFTQETIDSLATLGQTLKTIRARLIKDGIIINNQLPEIMVN